MDARSNPANVSDGLQNSSGHIGANTRYRLTKLGEQMARLPIDPKIARICWRRRNTTAWRKYW